ncbi:MAG: acyl-CoA dehydrogenase C-terminal domain-containing protein [Sterolibacterium sp.]|nr:acyl-CoA dehydrogenase C-terminal domain-containing protein [Sterolibacterium sp.]
MAQYNAPLRDMQFVMHELLNVEAELRTLPPHADIDAATIDQVVEEMGKFCSKVLFPLNHSGDREGCRFDPATQAVTTPKGYKEAYQQYIDAGWPSLACDPEFGGQGLPHVMSSVMLEMLNSANQAWTMYPGLSHGAYACLRAHGTPEQKAFYLPRLISGEWMGTMCLTEPHCGTDLGLLRSKAEPQADGSYKISGAKIFISAGEHDMAANIVHLVLARLPDAPAGTRGISLFLVPKFLPDASGDPGARNAISCGAIEEKMGIHGNATCQMNLDGATGWIIGEPHKGLNAMFVMMNEARLGVGLQSLGLTEVAYQNAVAYARERIQMRSLSGTKAPEQAADPIIVHPDVRRMLLTARAYAEGGRAFTTFVSLQADLETKHPDAAVREEAADLLALLTPIVKAFLTDNGWVATSEAMQVFGGHGYIAENGMEQYVRDARINMIYEGTNTIQSLDLLARKVLMDGGARLQKFGARVQAFIAENSGNEAMKEFIEPLADLGDKLTKLTMELGMKAMQNPDEVGAAAVPYLRVAGHLVYAWLFARMAKIALEKQATGDAFYQAKLATARFYFARLLPETAMLIRQARAGADCLLNLDAELF